MDRTTSSNRVRVSTPLVVGAVLFGLVGVAGLVGIGWFVTRGGDDLVPPVERLLETAEGGEYAAAYEMTGEAWKQAQSEAEFTGFLRSLLDLLGERRSLAQTSFHSSSVPSQGRTATAFFAAEYEHDESVAIRATLKKYGREWKVIGLYFETELMAQNAVCPECGALLTANARFCSQCGVALTEAGAQGSEAGDEP